MKIAVQLLEHSTGRRTKINAIERDEFADALLQLPDPEKYLIVVVMEMTEEGWDFSDCPLYSVQQFIEYYGARSDG